MNYEAFLVGILVGFAGMFVILKIAPVLAIIGARIVTPIAKSTKLQFHIAGLIWFGAIGGVFWGLLRFANILHGGVPQFLTWFLGFFVLIGGYRSEIGSKPVHIHWRIWQLIIFVIICVLSWLLD